MSRWERTHPSIGRMEVHERRDGRFEITFHPFDNRGPNPPEWPVESLEAAQRRADEAVPWHSCGNACRPWRPVQIDLGDK